MSKPAKDLFKVSTKTICHLDFNHVNSQYPCSRTVCECHEIYKTQLEQSRVNRRKVKELSIV